MTLTAGRRNGPESVTEIKRNERGRCEENIHTIAQPK